MRYVYLPPSPGSRLAPRRADAWADGDAPRCHRTDSPTFEFAARRHRRSVLVACAKRVRAHTDTRDTRTGHAHPHTACPACCMSMFPSTGADLPAPEVPYTKTRSTRQGPRRTRIDDAPPPAVSALMWVPGATSSPPCHARLKERAHAAAPEHADSFINMKSGATPRRRPA